MSQEQWECCGCRCVESGWHYIAIAPDQWEPELTPQGSKEAFARMLNSHAPLLAAAEAAERLLTKTRQDVTTLHALRAAIAAAKWEG